MPKPIDKSKLDARTNAFMKFFESQGVTFVDATPDTESEDKPTTKPTGTPPKQRKE